MSEHQRIPQSCTEADFYERLVEFFRPSVSTRPIDWACIQESMSYFAPFFKFREFVDLYFDYIYGLFEDFRITDRAVIDFCIRKYCRFKLIHCGFRLPDPNEFHFPVEEISDYEYHVKFNADPNERHFQADELQDYGVPHHEYFVLPQYVEQLLSRSFLFRDPTAVMRILRHVAPARMYVWVSHPVPGIPPDMFPCDDLSKYLGHVMRSMWQDPFFVEHVDEMTLNSSFDDEVIGYWFKLFLMAMDFLLQVRIENGRQDAIKGLRLLFQATPIPYITWIQISGMLWKVFWISPYDSQLSFIESMHESFKEFFPECLQGHNPRSLKHLARCQVRRCLYQARTLPHGVWSLRLPRELEDYVLLQSRKDQFRPVIRPLSSERVFVLRPEPDT